MTYYLMSVQPYQLTFKSTTTNTRWQIATDQYISVHGHFTYYLVFDIITITFSEFRSIRLLARLVKLTIEQL